MNTVAQKLKSISSSTADMATMSTTSDQQLILALVSLSNGSLLPRDVYVSHSFVDDALIVNVKGVSMWIDNRTFHNAIDSPGMLRYMLIGLIRKVEHPVNVKTWKMAHKQTKQNRDRQYI